ncbi:MAG: Yae1 family protein [Atopobiaceae bacterium]|nr:Yae1 family protein [Atopobiaceae bacterium]
MGGEVLELMDDKIERSRKEGIQEGIALGRQEGFELGRQEGYELGRQEGFERAESILAEQMAALGIDRAVIDRVMADAAASLKDMPHQ